MKILIVEDDPVSLKLACAVLQSGGHTVMSAMSADQAILSLTAGKPDAILLDLQLPGIKGLAIARQCREEPATCHIPIVAVTAFSSAYERADAVKAGCDAYLLKPINTRALLQEVESAVFAKAQQFR